MAEKNSCPFAGPCGSCSGLILPYEETVRAKQRRVEELLSSFGKVEPLLGMENPLHYRNKVHRVFSVDRKHRFHCGSYRAGSHFVIDVDHCLIEDRQSQRIIATVCELVRSFRIPVYDEDRETGLLRHILIRRGFASGEILVILVMTAPNFPGKHHFVQALLKAHPEITSLVLNLNSRHTTMVLGEKNVALSGSGYIQDTLCGLTFRLSPGSFYQVNPVQTERLYSLAIEYADLSGTETVLDAYCGIGTIGLTAASRAGKVIGVELNPDAVRDAKLNARINGITNAEFIRGDAGDYMADAARKNMKIDTVLMDPPRSGSTEKFLSSCVELSPRSIVYVSCNPETLRRDLLFLTARGYRVRRIRPVDMFPFTDHVESVAMLSRA